MVVRDIDIHGGVNNWYIEVSDPPRSYRVDIGYLSASGKFFTLARSNVVSTPKAGASSALDENWTDVAENFDKIYAMSGGYSPDNNSLELQELFEQFSLTVSLAEQSGKILQRVAVPVATHGDEVGYVPE